MTRDATIKSVKNKILEFDDDISFHFFHLDDIVEKLGSLPDVALAYCFSQIEFGHRRILYAGLLRIYRLDSEKSWDAVIGQDISREGYQQFYKLVFGNPIKKGTLDLIKPAEKIRDRMIHGKNPGTREMWGAVLQCIEYVTAMNQDIRASHGFAGFGRMQGVTGIKGKPPLPKAVSLLALKGLGFHKKTVLSAGGEQSS